MFRLDDILFPRVSTYRSKCLARIHMEHNYTILTELYARYCFFPIYYIWYKRLLLVISVVVIIIVFLAVGRHMQKRPEFRRS